MTSQQAYCGGSINKILKLCPAFSSFRPWFEQILKTKKKFVLQQKCLCSPILPGVMDPSMMIAYTISCAYAREKGPKPSILFEGKIFVF